MTVREKLNALAAQKILVLDGAMGSMIQAYCSSSGMPLSEEDYRGERFARHNKSLKGCNEVLCLSRPDVILGIHKAYLEAGADIIETCSLGATRVSLDDFGLGHLAREISAAAAGIARQAADAFSEPGKPRFVAGSIGPTAKSAAMTGDLDNPGTRQIAWDELVPAYGESIRGLVEGGADILLMETFYDGLNAKAALYAAERVSEDMNRDIPVMISASVTESGRLLTGQTPAAFCASLLHGNPWALGLNCSFGAERLKAPLETISAFVPCNVIFYPNAGLPDSFGRYSDTPENMASGVETVLKDGLVNIIGACCGSTPAHIAAIAEKAGNYRPRAVPEDKGTTILAGLEILETKNPGCFSRTAVPWQKALDSGDYEEAVEIARYEAEQDRGKAKRDFNILPVSADKAPDPVQTVKNFIFLAAAFLDIARIPVLIESARLDVIEEGLKCFQGRGLVRYLGPFEPGLAETIRSRGAVLL